MNAYNFTERVRKVLQLAREEAFALRHEYVGTEHILLGLCAGGGGVADAALRNLQIDTGAVREQLLKTVKPGKTNGDATAPTAQGGVGGLLGTIADSLGMTRHDLPYTSRAKKVLELAMSEARELSHSYVGTEHLLLGLMREEKGIAAQVLRSMGVTVAALREEVVRLLGTEMPAPAAGQSKQARSSREERQAAITLVVEHPDGQIEARKFRNTNDAVRYLNGLEY